MDFDFSSELILEDQHVLLRPLKDDDVQHLLQVATADDDLILYSPYRINTPERLAAFVSSSLQEREKHVRYPLVIFDKRTGLYAGSTSIATVSNTDKRLEIGWTWLGKRFQRSGLNRACKYLLLSYAFETLEFERVEFKIDARNTASRTAVEKIGGQYEGALRSHTVMLDGFRRTTVFYSILRDEWPGLKKTIFQAYAAH